MLSCEKQEPGERTDLQMRFEDFFLIILQPDQENCPLLAADVEFHLNPTLSSECGDKETDRRGDEPFTVLKSTFLHLFMNSVFVLLSLFAQCIH